MNHGELPPEDPRAMDEDELGAPIPELAALREEPPANLIERIRSGIRRRVFAADALDFSVRMTLRMLLEYVQMILSVFRTGESERGGSR